MLLPYDSIVTYRIGRSNVVTKHKRVRTSGPSKKSKTAISDVERIRRATGLDQAAFATALGFRPSTINNWECGKAGPNDEQKLSIAAFTGVLPWTLERKPGPPLPRDFANQTYNAESWTEWQKQTITAGQMMHLRKSGLRALLFVLKAVSEDNGGQQTDHAYRTFLIDFDAFLLRYVINAGLLSRVNNVVKDATVEVTSGVTTVGEVRAQLGKHPEWQIRDRRAWKANTAVNWKQKRYETFAPFIGFTKINNRGIFASGQRAFRQELELQIEGDPIKLFVDSVEPHSWIQHAGYNQPLGGRVAFFPPRPSEHA